MTNRFRSTRVVAAAVALMAAAACGKPAADPALAGDLQRDLDLAAAAGVTTAASNGVVSAQEQLPHSGQARPSTASRPSSSRPRAAAPAVAAPEPTETVAEAPVAEQPAAEPAVVAPAPAPATRPAPVRVQPAPRGGYKTVGEVIRDAPFPIYP